LVPLEARFHHAAFDMAPAFLAVLVAEVDFHASNMLREVAQGALHRGFGLPGHLFATSDVVICINLDFSCCFCTLVCMRHLFAVPVLGPITVAMMVLVQSRFIIARDGARPVVFRRLFDRFAGEIGEDFTLVPTNALDPLR
jgi:hypothetical protein